MTSFQSPFLLPTALLLVASCAIAAPVTVGEDPISEGILPALCEEFSREPGFDPATPIELVAQTRPLFNTFLLRVLHPGGEIAPEIADLDDQRDAQLRVDFQPHALGPVGPVSGCKFKLVEQCSNAVDSEAGLCLELSNLLADPLSRGAEEAGHFARLRLTNRENGTWYWVELSGTRAKEVSTSVFRLQVSDN